MQSLALCTPAGCLICPELSQTFPTSGNIGEEIAGEIDFYLNGLLKWGIELLVKGRGISEHLDRFSPSGKYYPLNVKDYAVVDFRPGDVTDIKRNPKRITVFFASDFSVCECICFEEKVSTIITLSN